jgi:hypothetical protein
VDLWNAAVNSGDATVASAFYEEDAQLVASGTLYNGTAEIETFFQAMYDVNGTIEIDGSAATVDCYNHEVCTVTAPFTASTPDVYTECTPDGTDPTLCNDGVTPSVPCVPEDAFPVGAVCSVSSGIVVDGFTSIVLLKVQDSDGSIEDDSDRRRSLLKAAAAKPFRRSQLEDDTDSDTVADDVDGADQWLIRSQSFSSAEPLPW